MGLKSALQILSILLISAMGPYVLPQMGIRVEHFVMYPMLVFFSVKSNLALLFGAKQRHVFIIVGLFLFLLLVFLANTYASDFHPPIYKVLADVDNYTQPICLILITNYCLRRLSRDELYSILANVIKTIILLLSINTVLAISSVFYGIWFLKYFNVAGEISGGWTVLESAATMGRFTGIFNQPFEAGVAYGIGLISIIFMFMVENKLSSRLIRPAYLILGFVLVMVGGVLSVSKVFFPLSIAISLVFFLAGSRRFLKVALRQLLLAILIISAITYVLLDAWDGSAYFLRLVNFEQGADLVELYSAGRFASSAGGTSVVTDHLTDSNLLLGYGLGSIQTPDNGYLEVLYFGGAVGVLIYIALLFTLFYYSIKGLHRQPFLAWYMTSLIVFVAVAGLGAPIFGINRSNFFLIIPLTVGLHMLALRTVRLTGCANLSKNHSLLFKQARTPVIPVL